MAFDTSTALHFKMVYRHRAQSVYSLNLPQETVGTELNVLPIASPLDKEYIAWLGNTTSNLWPLIRIHDDQLAQHIYEQNFNPGIPVTGRILGDRSALTSLCGKYGPLGHDTTFTLVSETAWVASYRVSPHCLQSVRHSLKLNLIATLCLRGPRRSAFGLPRSGLCCG